MVFSLKAVELDTHARRPDRQTYKWTCSIRFDMNGWGGIDAKQFMDLRNN
jgi:hypothetical protein